MPMFIVNTLVVTILVSSMLIVSFDLLLRFGDNNKNMEYDQTFNL